MQQCNGVIKQPFSILDNGYFIVFYHDALYVLPAAEFVAGVTRLSSYEQPTTGESAILASAATLGVA